MLESILRSTIIPAALVTSVTLLCAGGLILADGGVSHPGALTTLCAVGIVATIALVLLRRRTASLLAVGAAAIGLAASAAVWGSARSTVPGAIALVSVAAFFVVAVLATLVRAERSEEWHGSSID